MKLSVYVVGSNPLPVLMVLCYDLKLVNDVSEDHEKPRHILFVQSKDTEKYVEGIKDWLYEKKIGIEISHAELAYVHNSEDAYRSVYKEMNSLYENYKRDGTNIDSLFLNNTGGTKVMSVSTTLAMIDIAKEKHISLLEADVDPEEKKITVHDPIERCCKPSWSVVCKSLDGQFGGLIKTSDIIALHGYEPSKGGLKKPSYTLGSEDKTLAFAKELLDNIEPYRAFSGMFFANKSAAYSKKTDDSIMTELDEIAGRTNVLNRFYNFDKDLKPTSSDPISKAFFESFSRKGFAGVEVFLKLLTDYGILNDEYHISMEKLRFLSGIWIEEYICAAIEKIIGEDNENGRYEVFNSFKIEPKANDRQRRKDTNFEIDVVFRNGITTTFISCTTAENQGLTNHKTLEVLANADSLGLRTQTIMVTLVSKAKMEKENKNLLARYEMFAARHYRKLEIIHLEEVKDSEVLQDKLRKLLF